MQELQIDLAVPFPLWSRALERGLRGGTDREVDLELPLGVASDGENLRLLARRPGLLTPDRGLAGGVLRLAITGHPSTLPVAAPGSVGGWTAVVVVGCGPQEGAIRARAVAPWGKAYSIATIHLPGPGMHQLVLGRLEQASNRVDSTAAERWSRSAGAMGVESWQRLCGLQVGIVGSGRLGSAIAESLARNGIHRLVLVDPDAVELHTLGEGAALSEDDIGEAKAVALARQLRKNHPWVDAESVSVSVTSWDALRVLKTCELLICCADTDGGRLAAGLLAARYCIPLLDIGTAVLREYGGVVRGAEVRLVLPADGCLGCLGGVTDLHAARAQTASPEAERIALREVDWRSRRAGSLRSLNLQAVGFGLGLLERLVAGEQERSVWIQLTWAGSGPPRVRAQGPRRTPALCLCDQMGLGDLR